MSRNLTTHRAPDAERFVPKIGTRVMSNGEDSRERSLPVFEEIQFRPDFAFCVVVSIDIVLLFLTNFSFIFVSV